MSAKCQKRTCSRVRDRTMIRIVRCTNVSSSNDAKYVCHLGVRRKFDTLQYLLSVTLDLSCWKCRNYDSFHRKRLTTMRLALFLSERFNLGSSRWIGENLLG